MQGFFNLRGPVPVFIDMGPSEGGGGIGENGMGGGFPIQYWGQVVPAPPKVIIPARMGPPTHKLKPDDPWNTDPHKPLTKIDSPDVSPDLIKGNPLTETENTNITHVGVSKESKPGASVATIGIGKDGHGNGIGEGFGEGGGSGFGFGGYLKVLRKRIWEEWAVSSVYGSADACVVGLTVSLDGSVGEVQLEKPSGNQLYDTLALRAVRNASPLPPLPPEFPKPNQRFRIEFKLLE